MADINPAFDGGSEDRQFSDLISNLATLRLGELYRRMLVSKFTPSVACGDSSLNEGARGARWQLTQIGVLIADSINKACGFNFS